MLNLTGRSLSHLITLVKTRWLSCKIFQDSCKKWLSCTILQENGYFARSCKTMAILQDLARRMVILQDSCKFVPVELCCHWLF